jgi:hypothetical protein
MVTNFAPTFPVIFVKLQEPTFLQQILHLPNTSVGDPDPVGSVRLGPDTDPGLQNLLIFLETFLC